ncbi:MAG TPA: hypothetical protein VGD00_09750 [Solirubrobacteraceae bacterium]|jgi:serine/threonine protein kinase HipA of HipAB toxin-antitoxin module
MGLLDEAIRDHLELKRRRGADPTEIARAQRDALEPVFPGEAPQTAEQELAEDDPAQPEFAPQDTDAALEQAPEPARAPNSAEPLTAEAADAAEPHFSTPTLGQETAELDVEAYMQAEVDAPAPQPPPSHAEQSDDELLEWEQPSAAAEPPPEQIPGQERLSLE